MLHCVSSSSHMVGNLKELLHVKITKDLQILRPVVRLLQVCSKLSSKNFLALQDVPLRFDLHEGLKLMTVTQIVLQALRKFYHQIL